jgi:hypothetical protein
MANSILKPIPQAPGANKPLAIRAQANKAKQQGAMRKARWQQMMSGVVAQKAAEQLITERGLIDRFIDRILYGTAP